jgi:hypothetical protein
VLAGGVFSRRFASNDLTRFATLCMDSVVALDRTKVYCLPLLGPRSRYADIDKSHGSTLDNTSHHRHPVTKIQVPARKNRIRAKIEIMNRPN